MENLYFILSLYLCFYLNLQSHARHSLLHFTVLLIHFCLLENFVVVVGFVFVIVINYIILLLTFMCYQYYKK